MTKKSEELKESKELEETRALEKLVESYKEKKDKVETIDEFLRKYNPWKGKDFDGLLNDFLEALKKDDKEFSWLKIDNGLYNELKDKNGRAASIDYGIPSHVRGDIEKGTVFLCLVNPNIDVKVAMCEACQMKNEEDIKKYIFNPGSEGGILYKEILELKGMKKLIGLKESDEDKNQEKNEIGYYTANYFNVILLAINDYKSKDEKEYEDLKKAVKSFETFISNLEENDDKKPTNEENINIEDLNNFVEISKKVVNLEAFPFRSSTPNFAINDEDVDACEKRFANCLVKSTSNVSKLSARIIIWKILEYLNSDGKKAKPVFIFRRFNRAWRPSIENVLKEYFGKDDTDNDTDIDNIINELHEEFFYTIGPKDQDNMLKMSKNIYKENVNIYNKKEKRNEFNKRISDALTPKKDKKENKEYE
ncbi:MAG: hypothetical protein ACLR8C_07965 [Finegoldia magna]|uniref:hypothetical protein n=1 Tax=Finegoldia magna TaxID=1260 RepID=UPI0039A35469